MKLCSLVHSAQSVCPGIITVVEGSRLGTETNDDSNGEYAISLGVRGDAI